MPRRRLGPRQLDPAQCIGQIPARADLLMIRHQPGDGSAVLEQDEGDVLIMSAVDAIGKIARSLSNADDLLHKIRLSDIEDTSNSMRTERGFEQISIRRGMPHAKTRRRKEEIAIIYEHAKPKSHGPSLLWLKMQLRVFPIHKSTVAIEGGAAEVDGLVLILEEPDIATEEEVLAFCAETHLVQCPPLLEGIVGLQELELAPECGDERAQGGVGIFAFLSHRENEPSTGCGVQWFPVWDAQSSNCG